MTKAAGFCLTTSLLLFGLAAAVSAQTNPPMAGQLLDNDKESLYARFTQYKMSINPDQHRLACPTAKEYVRRYGGDRDPYAREAQKFVTECDRGFNEVEIFNAYKARDYVKALELGRVFLKTMPDDFFVLGTLTELGYDTAVAGNGNMNEETIGYARRAIQLIESDKVTKPDPFIDMGAARGFLNAALGWFLKDQSPIEAAGAFRKAIQSDSPYRKDPVIHHRLGVAILKGEFAQLSAEYNQKYGTSAPSPEQAAMFERITHLGDQAVDAYARAVALMTRPEQQETRGKILAQLTALYKSLHGNSDAGLNELISSVLSKPIA